MGIPRAQRCTFLSMACRPVNRQLNSMYKVCYSRGTHRWSETTKEAGKREINLILGSQKYFLEEQFSKISVHRSTWKASGPPTPTASPHPRVSASVSLGQKPRICISNTFSTDADLLLQGPHFEKHWQVKKKKKSLIYKLNSRHRWNCLLSAKKSNLLQNLKHPFSSGTSS